MIMKRIITTSLLLSLLGGCAIHPTQQDVTGISTYYIVRTIRCEAKYAILNEIMDILDHNDDKGNHQKDRSVANTMREMIKNNIDSEFSVKFFEENIENDTKKEFVRYKDIGIAYDFTLDIVEDDKIGGSADITNFMSFGTFKSGLSATSDHMRHSNRNFQVLDNFKDLIGRKLECTGTLKVGDFDYPIRGKIGIDNIIKTFVDINEFTGFAQKKVASFGDDALVFADTLDFTTEISGGASPIITLNPIKRGAGLLDASIGPSLDRKDKHTIIVALALPPSEAKNAKPPAPKTGSAVAPFTSKQSTASPDTTERRLQNAIQNQIDRSLINTLQQRLN